MKKKQILILMLLSIANLTLYGPSDGDAPVPDAGLGLGGSSGEPVDQPPGDGDTQSDIINSGGDNFLNGMLGNHTDNGGYEVPTVRSWRSSSSEGTVVAPEGSDVALTPGAGTPDASSQSSLIVAQEDNSFLNRSTLTPEQRRAQWEKQYNTENRDENRFATQYNQGYADRYVPEVANEGMSDQQGMSDQSTGDQVPTVQDPASVWGSAELPQDLQGPEYRGQEDTQGMAPDETLDSDNNPKIVITLDPEERMTGLKLKLQSMRRQVERRTNAVKEQVKSTGQKVANKANTLRESMKQSFRDRTAKKQEQARIAKQKAAEEKAKKEKEMQAKKAQLKQKRDEAAEKAKSMPPKEKVTWRDFFTELALTILSVAAGAPV